MKRKEKCVKLEIYITDVCIFILLLKYCELASKLELLVDVEFTYISLVQHMYISI